MRNTFFKLLLSAFTLWGSQSFAASETTERALISDSVKKALYAEDFTKLESISRAFRRSSSRTASGIWKLSIFYGSIMQAARPFHPNNNSESTIITLEKKTTKWMQQHPKSPSGYIAHSIILLQHAWYHRGPGLASTVKPEGWANFRKYVKMARDNLEANKFISANDPRWYETMLDIAKLENWDRRQFDIVFNEALDREPHYYQTYFKGLDYLLPIWHGRIQDIEDFAQDASRKTEKIEGRAMYARIYWYASQIYWGHKIFEQSLATWPKLKEGFEDIIKQYPDAWNINHYAQFACLANDKIKTLELIRRTNNEVVPEAWYTPQLYNQCYEWSRE